MNVEDLIKQLSFYNKESLVVIGIGAGKKEITEVHELDIKIKRNNKLHGVVQLG